MSNSVFMEFKPFQGPSAYTFIDPDTQHQYTAQNQAELVRMILGYRQQNRLEPIEALNEVLENYWCRQRENKGKCSFYQLKRGFLETMKGGISLLTNYMYDKFVTQDQADARASICIECPENVDPEKGMLVAWEDEIAQACVGDRKSKYHDRLHTCKACGCLLKGKVFYSGKLELEPDTLAQMPVGKCWQREEFLANG